MSAPTSTSTAAAAAPTGSSTGEHQTNLPHLGVLDEDDEFEEFEVQDWGDSETTLSKLGGGAGGTASGGGVGLGMTSRNGGGNVNASDHLWEDNWDDDDVEDDFSKALRAELDKQSSSTAMTA